MVRSEFGNPDRAELIDRFVYAIDKVKSQLAKPARFVGDNYTLADINTYSVCSIIMARVFHETAVAMRCPRLAAWCERRTAPAVARSLTDEKWTAPILRPVAGSAR